MPAQPEQPWTRHCRSGQAASDWPFKWKTNRFRPDSQAQTAPDLTDPVRKASNRASKSRQDIPASSRTFSQQSRSDETALNLPFQMGQTHHHGPNNFQTCRHRKNTVRRDIQAQTGQAQPQTRHPMQTGRFNSDLTAYGQTPKLRSHSFQRRRHSQRQGI